MRNQAGRSTGPNIDRSAITAYMTGTDKGAEIACVADRRPSPFIIKTGHMEGTFTDGRPTKGGAILAFCRV